MKKYLFTLVLIFGLSYNLLADSPSFNYTGCHKESGRRIELYRDGSCLYIDANGSRYEGSYSWTKNHGTSGDIKMEFKSHNFTLRGTVFMSNGHGGSRWEEYTYLDIEQRRYGYRSCFY